MLWWSIFGLIFILLALAVVSKASDYQHFNNEGTEYDDINLENEILKR